ncbi:MAG: PAS domain-containing protein, partial [Thermoanaerobaculia bacterium]|nr:PAS domain-containing protein [Thermoanaerobaculia bacterium]
MTKKEHLAPPRSSPSEQKESRSAEEILRASSANSGGLTEEQQYYLHLLAEQLPTATWTTDNLLRLTWISGRGLPESIRRAGGELIGQPIRNLIPKGERAEDFIAVHRDALHGHDSTFEHEWHDRWYLSHVAPLRDTEGTIVGTMGIAQNVTQRKESDERATYQSLHDPLTGFPNRLLFQDR